MVLSTIILYLLQDGYEFERPEVKLLISKSLHEQMPLSLGKVLCKAFFFQSASSSRAVLGRSLHLSISIFTSIDVLICACTYMNTHIYAHIHVYIYADVLQYSPAAGHTTITSLHPESGPAHVGIHPKT